MTVKICQVETIYFSNIPTSNDKVSTDMAGTIIKANKEAEVNIVYSY